MTTITQRQRKMNTAAARRSTRGWPLDRKLDLGSRPHRNGCVIWNGYGRLWWNGRNRSIRRLVYAEAKGPIPPDMKILVRCGNARCIALSHLYAASQVTLTALIRRPRGEANGNHKLTAQQVQSIRRAKATQVKISERFGVSVRTISLIRQHRAWKHLL